MDHEVSEDAVLPVPLREVWEWLKCVAEFANGHRTYTLIRVGKHPV